MKLYRNIFKKIIRVTEIYVYIEKNDESLLVLIIKLVPVYDKLGA